MRGEAGGEVRPGVSEAVTHALRTHFRPEFLNRVDDIVLFSRCSTNARIGG